MKNKYINNITLFALAFLPVVWGCSAKTEEHADEHEENENVVELTLPQFAQANIEIGKVKMQILGTELQVSGQIEVPPQGNVSINMPYGGFIKNITMLPGTKVKKGQLLVTIENPDFIQFQQEYLENLAKREFLKAEFERQQSLYKENVASGKNFQQAKSDYETNEAGIKSMEARLQLIGFNLQRLNAGKVSSSVNIYSPITGSVREVYTNIGKYINPKDVIMDLTDAHDLHVELTVYENDAPRVADGQRILFTVANAPHKVREAEVFLIGSSIRENRSVTVHGHLKNPDGDLLPGMYVSAQIVTDSHEVLAVPETAVVRFNGKHYVFISMGKEIEHEEEMYKFEMKEVIIGYQELGFVQIAYKIGNETLEKDDIALSGASVLLAKAKNSEEGGHHH
ncbi:MAG TPA: efflux RND transporter periplasmic adaptor subunit [Fulvivirga sp.]|nr:efflux RND transporter periplasmic adaptor subunit [Fulvivirga sp.]